MVRRKHKSESVHLPSSTATEHGHHNHHLHQPHQHEDSHVKQILSLKQQLLEARKKIAEQLEDDKLIRKLRSEIEGKEDVVAEKDKQLNYYRELLLESQKKNNHLEAEKAQAINLAEHRKGENQRNRGELNSALAQCQKLKEEKEQRDVPKPIVPTGGTGTSDAKLEHELQALDQYWTHQLEQKERELEKLRANAALQNKQSEQFAARLKEHNKQMIKLRSENERVKRELQAAKKQMDEECLANALEAHQFDKMKEAFGALCTQNACLEAELKKRKAGVMRSLFG